MKKLLFIIAGFVALMIFIVNLGPMILLGISIWLLYVVFKQFLKSDSTGGKIGWAIVGLFILSIATANVFSLVGIGAAIVLYFIFKNWNNKEYKSDGQVIDDNDDPFTNFERQWSQFNH